jgi:hypothetical protein
MQAIEATTRAPRATLCTSCAIPQLERAARSALDQQTPCGEAHVEPLYRTRPRDSGSI